MNLIDADKLMEDVLNSMPTGSARGVFRAFIEEQPTAFNVEKVVEQLEESYFLTESTFDDDGWCNDDSEEVVNLNEAIEIIKAGGLDE